MQLRELIRQKVKEERRITAEVLKLLLEVDQKMLFAEWGYGSIQEYCIEELKYSRSAAQRRIDAMRVLKIAPEVEKKIEIGRASCRERV